MSGNGKPSVAAVSGAWRVQVSFNDKAGMLSSGSASGVSDEGRKTAGHDPTNDSSAKEEKAKRASEIVLEMSKNSAYFANEQRKSRSSEARALEMRKQRVEVEAEVAKNLLRAEADRPAWMRAVDAMVDDLTSGFRIQSQKSWPEGGGMDASLSQQQQQQQQGGRHTAAVGHKGAFSGDLTRIFVHADLDCFYAAVAVRDNPSLAGKPVGVGGMSMLSTASYEAREFGVRSAMPGFIAKKLCPDLIIVPSDFKAYKLASSQTMSVLRRYDPDARKMSLDEASLDVTEFLRREQAQRSQVSFGFEDTQSPTIGVPERENLCKRIMSEVEAATGGLTCSLGIAPNRRIAKICADFNKPRGFKVVPPTVQAVRAFMDVLPVRKVSGIGKVTAHLLSAAGVETCGQLFEQRYALAQLFSPDAAEWFIAVSLGLGSSRDAEGASSYYPPTARKSVSSERTFRSTTNADVLKLKLGDLCDRVCEACCDLAEQGLRGGRCVTIKLKLENFELKNRSFTLPGLVPNIRERTEAGENSGGGRKFTADPATLREVVLAGFENELPLKLPVRLMGVKISNLVWSATERAKANPQSIVNFFKNGVISTPTKVEPTPPRGMAMAAAEPRSSGDQEECLDEELVGDEEAIPLTPIRLSPALASVDRTEGTSGAGPASPEEPRDQKRRSKGATMTDFYEGQPQEARWNVLQQAAPSSNCAPGARQEVSGERGSRLDRWVQQDLPEDAPTAISCPICGSDLSGAVNKLWMNDHVEQCLERSADQQKKRAKRLQNIEGPVDLTVECLSESDDPVLPVPAISRKRQRKTSSDVSQPRLDDFVRQPSSPQQQAQELIDLLTPPSSFSPPRS